MHKKKKKNNIDHYILSSMLVYNNILSKTFCICFCIILKDKKGGWDDMLWYSKRMNHHHVSLSLKTMV